MPHPVPRAPCPLWLCSPRPRPTEFDEPQALAVLLEEELVVLDLQTPGWPAVPAPYLAPLHSSAITCSAHVANVPAKLWARIVSAGEQQSPQPASSASVCAQGLLQGGDAAREGVPGIGSEARLWPVYTGNSGSLGPGCPAEGEDEAFVLTCFHISASLSQSWPITGGRNLAQEPSQRGLLLTG